MRRLARLATTSFAGVLLLASTGCGNQAAPGGGSVPEPRTPTPPRAVAAQPVEPDGGLQCPASITDRAGRSVPARPQGLDGGARLLPDRAPLALVDCAYPVLDIRATTSSGPPFVLARRTLVTGKRAGEVVGLLAWASRDDGRDRACTEIGGNETVHLVGARYDDAIVWVASLAEPNRCSTSTNGDFVSPLSAGYRLEQWFGADPVQEADQGCGGWSQGRLGDDVSLAPDGGPSVTVCRSTPDGQQATRLTADQSGRVVAAIRSLHTGPLDRGCADAAPGSGTDFRLVLGYPRGPDVVISVVPSCTPQLSGSRLRADDARAVIDLVEQWSPPTVGYDPDGTVSSPG